MPGKQRIDLYCLCWNDARMLPFFFRHYDDLVDRYFVYDNGSTDASLSLLKSHGRVEITHFDTPGDSFVEEERRLCDTIWRNSTADWVIVTDLDEHIYHPHFLEYLRRCSETGVTAIQSVGYEMVSDDFPDEADRLVETVTIGTRSIGCDRLCIFNPKAITNTNFTVGRHEAEPAGNVRFPPFPEVLLLHYKQLGVDYPIVRSAELRRGLRARDLAEGWGFHYSWSEDEIRSKWQEIRSAAGPVPGLGVLKHLEPAKYFEDDHNIRRSGLFDHKWYLSNYPDVATAGADPFVHYCIHGWKEGRQPNFYFQSDWYCDNYPETLTPGRNPLCDYLDRGEPVGARPSPRFDASWYRGQHGLALEQSPLRHYFEHRMTGNVSPVAEFDVASYCKNHPDVLDAGLDPFEEFCKESFDEPHRPPRNSRRKRGRTSSAATKR